ncbi:MAG TPA: TspO/MBR family protein [Caulobacteraceae bacterium]
MLKRTRDTLGSEVTRRRGQTAREVGAGLALTAGAVIIAALVARRDVPGESEWDALKRPAFRSPRALFGVVWPPLFIALTLSSLRLWNTPASAARTRALTLWTAIQALTAAWMALGTRRLGGRLTTAVATLGTAAAYAFQARRIDAPAAGLAAPYLGWIGFANVLTEQLWRKAPAPATVH